MKAERMWQALALVLAVAAAAALLDSALSRGRRREIEERKRLDLRRIQSHEGRWAREETLRFRLEAGRLWRPADLEGLARVVLGADAARVVQRPAEAISDGWQRREAVIEVFDADYADVATLLASAADGLPPWRLREVESRPFAEPGRGAATLVVEAVEKKRP